MLNPSETFENPGFTAYRPGVKSLLDDTRMVKTCPHVRIDTPPPMVGLCSEYPPKPARRGMISPTSERVWLTATSPDMPSESVLLLFGCTPPPTNWSRSLFLV